MSDRYSDETRDALRYANQQAQRFNHEWIEPEHILLGVIKAHSVNIALTRLLPGRDEHGGSRYVRLQVEKATTVGARPAIMGKLPLSAQAKSVMAHADAYLDSPERIHPVRQVIPGDVLVGLLTETDSLAFRLLTGLDLTRENVIAQLNAVVREELLERPSAADGNA